MENKREKVTIYDISKEAGVSIATVSRVLNGYTNVSPKTRDKINQVMEEMGYKPNAFARGLGLDTMQTIGILCADSSDSYLAKAVYYIEEELRANNYDSLLCCTGFNPSDKAKSLDLLLSKKVDAAILVGSHFLETSPSGNKYIKDAADYIPIMLLNAYFEYPNVYSLYCDDYSATKNSIRYLFEKGKKKILYIYNSKSYSGQRKLDGFKQAYEEEGLSQSSSAVVYCGANREDIDAFVKIISDAFDKYGAFDAIVASEDYLAVSALKFAIKKGILVPDKLSIIGYNNSSLATMTEPEISSVDNKLEAMSKQLVATLLGVLSGKEMPKKTEYSGVLVERGTT